MPLSRKPPSPAAPGPAPDIAAVLKAFATGSEEERWSAARAAAEIPASATPLGEALAREPSARVREAMFTALARIATPESVESTLPYLRSDQAQVRTEALDALKAMKSAVWPYLAALIRDENPHVRVLACDLVRDMPGDRAARLLCDLLDWEPTPNVCAAAIEALAEIGGADALPALTRCAARFPADPFIEFSIKIAADRIRAQDPTPRA